jgi:hypothetical protein
MCVDPRTAAILRWFDLVFEIHRLERIHWASLERIRAHGPLTMGDWLIAALADEADSLNAMLSSWPEDVTTSAESCTTAN